LKDGPAVRRDSGVPIAGVEDDIPVVGDTRLADVRGRIVVSRRAELDILADD
jgi:hypothetical protein